MAPHLMLESGPERRGDADVALRQASDSDVLADGGTEADVVVDAVGYDYIEDEHQASDQGLVMRQSVQTVEEMEELKRLEGQEGRRNDLGRNEQTPGQGEEVELRRVEGEGQGEGRSEEEEATDRGNRMDGQERKEGGVEMEAGGAMERGGEMEVGGEMEEEGGVEGEEGPDIELELVMGDAELDEAEIFVGQLAADVADVHAPDGHVAGAHWQALREDLSAPQDSSETGSSKRGA
ncbi:unnamed protein product [Closterium sp. Naga37s-1]|nr:unnamed protein product [Closterium sp. Naga37s-1]